MTVSKAAHAIADGGGPGWGGWWVLCKEDTYIPQVDNVFIGEYTTLPQPPTGGWYVDLLSCYNSPTMYGYEC